MPFVWRYEDENGDGPYKSSSSEQLQDMKSLHIGDDWPSWYEDFRVPWADKGFISGFPTWTAAMVWFDGFHEVLVECGYVLYRYSVPAYDVEVGRSGKQVRFFRPS